MVRNTGILSAALFFSFFQFAGAQNITYEFEALSLGNGYEIASGFIETDGTQGILAPSNITSYAASLTGPIPFEFNSSNIGSKITFTGDIVADMSTLTIGEDTDPENGVLLGIRFAAVDNTNPECSDCHQDLIVRNTLSNSRNATEVLYDHHDHSDDMPDTGFLTFRVASPQIPFTFQAQTEPGLTGDFNASGAYEAEDIDLLCEAIGMTSADGQFDLDGSGALDMSDFESLLNTMEVLPGDADLNGTVEFSDFLSLSNSFGSAAGWSNGDFDCSGVVEFPDFLQLSRNFGLSADAVASVPEPASLPLMFAALALSLRWRRHRG